MRPGLFSFFFFFGLKKRSWGEYRRRKRWAGREQDSAARARLAKTSQCRVPKEKAPRSWEIALHLCLIEATASVEG